MASQFEVNVVVTPDAGLQQRLQSTIDAGRYTLRIERIDAQAAIANFRHQLSLAISGVLQNSGNQSRRLPLNSELNTALGILTNIQSRYRRFMNEFSQTSLGGVPVQSRALGQNMLSHYDNLLQTIEQVQAGNAGVIDSVIAGTHAETASMNSAMEAAQQLRTVLSDISNMRAHRDSLINLGANRGVNAQRIAELNAQLSIMDGYARNLANGVVPTQAMTQAFEVARDSAGDMLAQLDKVMGGLSYNTAPITKMLGQINTLLADRNVVNQRFGQELTALQDVIEGTVVGGTRQGGLLRSDGAYRIEDLKAVQEEFSRIQSGIAAAKKAGEGPWAKVQVEGTDTALAMLSQLESRTKSVLKSVSGVSLGGVATEDLQLVKSLDSAYSELGHTIQSVKDGDRSVIDAVRSGAKQSVNDMRVAVDAAEKFASYVGRYTQLRGQRDLLEQLGGDPAQIQSLNNQLKIMELSLARIGRGASFDQMADKIANADAKAQALVSSLKKQTSVVVSDKSAFQSVVDELNAMLGGKLSPGLAKEVENVRDQFVKLASKDIVKVGQIEEAQQALAGLKEKIENTEKSSKSLGQSLKATFAAAIKQRIISQIFTLASKAIKEVISTVKEINDSMTQLEIVTGANERTMSNFLDQATEKAKKLGANISQILDSIEVFSRLGYSLSDALDLANAATLMSNVGNTTVDDATTGLTSIIKGFGLEASEAELVTDKLVEVGQKYAISASELMTAMQNGGASMAAANNSLDETIAIFAAGNAAVQDASKVGGH